VNVSTILAAKGAGVVTVDGGHPAWSVMEQLAQHRIGAVVVCDDGHRFVGVVTERDIIRDLVTSCGPRRQHRCAAELVSDHTTICQPGTGLVEVMTTMTRRRVRHVPVIDEGELVGIVSIGDAVKARLEELEFESRILREAHLALR
jgi:CBS domain-containing protein